LVLGNKDDKPEPTPTPPGPVPPTPPGPPIDDGYNLYYLNYTDILRSKSVLSGVLTFNTSYVNNDKFLERTKKTADIASG
jgi:hypothetical protein